MIFQSTKLLERTYRPGIYELSGVSWSQLEPGTFNVHYGFLEAGPIILSSRSYNTGVKAAAGLVPHASIIGVTGDLRTQARCYGKELSSENIFSARSFLEMSTNGPARFCSITLHEESLAREFPTTPDVLALLEKTQKTQWSEDPFYAQRLRASITLLFALSAEGAGFMLPHGMPAKRVYGSLLPMVAAALERFDTHNVEASKCLTKRLAAVRICESYIREHCSEAVSLLDLSRVSGMTSRSLTNAFQAVTGLSPVDYLRRVRLSGAHHALLLANKDNAKVTDVATAWGFWHMGHFTYHYRKMFGETPSQTLVNA